ncbi:MAG TPA: electron transfer flavoprotein subunit beta/FixA family protein [Chloroflexota bacterium]|nr:electron transfer flavoprotein subunit beta/FixA family protein [Chloroflexota bacterium]
MHIAVCINHIPDPEAPAKQFKLDEQTNRPLLQRANRVVGPFDENALETALQLKDLHGAKVTALTVGPASNVEALRRALATRCDAAVHVKEDGASELDSLGIARLLKAAVQKLGDVDLVLCGRQVGDWDSGQVGQLLAEEMGIPCVTLARQIEPSGESALRVTREVPGGTALVESQLPAVLTVTNAPTNQLRIPKVKDVMLAHRAPITTWTSADLGIDMSELAGGARVVVGRMFIPESSIQVELIRGETDEEVAETLAQRIVGLKVI